MEKQLKKLGALGFDSIAYYIKKGETSAHDFDCFKLEVYSAKVGNSEKDFSRSRLKKVLKAIDKIEKKINN
jgi:hypothetical protein